MANQNDGRVRATEEPPTSCQRLHFGSHIRCEGSVLPAEYTDQHGEGADAEQALLRIGGHISTGRSPSFEPNRALRWASLLVEISETPGGIPACSDHVKREALDLRDTDGRIALERFPACLCVHRDAIIARAFHRLCRDELPLAVNAPRPDAYFRYVVRSEAFAWTERCVADAGAVPDLTATARAALHQLRHARIRVKRLSELEQQLLCAYSVLDSIASENEAPRIMLTGAVAFEMRRNAAHKHISRLRAKLFPPTDGQPKDDWKHAWKYVLKPTAEQSLAAREYLDACQTHKEGLERWTGAHKAHNECTNTSKKRSREAAFAWRACIAALHADALQPRHLIVPLIVWSRQLGIDAQVVPQRVAQTSWRELLGQTKRPSKKVLPAWDSFLDAHPFGAAVLDRWQAFQAASVLAWHAKAAVDSAYDHLLSAALATPKSFTDALIKFRNLVGQ